MQREQDAPRTSEDTQTPTGAEWCRKKTHHSPTLRASQTSGFVNRPKRGRKVKKINPWRARKSSADDLEQKSLSSETLPCFFSPRTAAWRVRVMAVWTWINKKYFFSSVHQLLNTKGRFSLKDKSSGPSTEHSVSALKLKTSHYAKWLYEQNSIWKHLNYIRFFGQDESLG